MPYNINIMNKKGYIIASGNKSRINTLHVGAVDAIKQRKTLPMDQQYGNHGQPGVNMPLKFKNEIIGVVGITGDPNKVTPLASLLKTAVELLLQQKQENEQEHEIEKVKQRFIYRWINVSKYQDPQLDSELVEEANHLNINLGKQRRIIATAGSSQIIKNLKLDQKPIIFSLTNHIELIILSSKYQETYIQQKLEHQEIEYGISNWGNLLGRLTEQAVATLRLSNIFGKPSFRYYSQISFIKQILDSNLNLTAVNDRYESLLKRKDGKELIDTICEFIKCNMSVNQTAHNLFVHRNTLNNRLLRIKKLFELDPKNTEDLFQLFIGYISFYYRQTL
ncbi:sugar diacid recognition domain-containing protein [Limosilactobacillus reuteri subsp. suis]|uniref:CdaR family transcriptional regulator n=1 Tax=Limosilactobacillus reuteri TaxID=1598 RepID=UPI003993EF6E